MTVADLEAKMSVDEFREWAVYVQIESERQKEAMKNGNRQTSHSNNR